MVHSSGAFFYTLIKNKYKTEFILEFHLRL